MLNICDDVRETITVSLKIITSELIIVIVWLYFQSKAWYYDLKLIF